MLEDRLTLRVSEVTKATGLGQTKICELMKTGELERVKVGRATLVTVASIKRLIETNSQARAA